MREFRRRPTAATGNDRWPKDSETPDYIPDNYGDHHGDDWDEENGN